MITSARVPITRTEQTQRRGTYISNKGENSPTAYSHLEEQKASHLSIASSFCQNLDKTIRARQRCSDSRKEPSCRMSPVKPGRPITVALSRSAEHT
jgi:hypothetical protein